MVKHMRGPARRVSMLIGYPMFASRQVSKLVHTASSCDVGQSRYNQKYVCASRSSIVSCRRRRWQLAHGSIVHLSAKPEHKYGIQLVHSVNIWPEAGRPHL